ncbi:MAG: hypothetical protein NVS2B14_08120 [Chamaesiphon sp.]
MLQYSVHAPTEFIRTHLDKLLPRWSVPVLSVLVVLQLCQFAFLERTGDTETYKNQFRQQFIEFGSHIVLQLRAMGHLADMFDPHTGWPIISPPGQLRLSDVKVVHSVLGYSINDSGPCAMIIHPTWGKAVYPFILVSSAHPPVVKSVVDSIIASQYCTAQPVPAFIKLEPADADIILVPNNSTV